MAPAFVCIGFIVMACYAGSGFRGQGPGAINSYCAAYQRIIRNEEEGAQLGRIESRAVRERIAANETLYRCECQGLDHAICRREAQEARLQARQSYQPQPFGQR